MLQLQKITIFKVFKADTLSSLISLDSSKDFELLLLVFLCRKFQNLINRDKVSMVTMQSKTGDNMECQNSVLSTFCSVS